MRFYLLVAAALLFGSPALCETPSPAVRASAKVPEGMEGLSWHKWDSDNFVVISLDGSSGSSMKSAAEETRKDLLARWGVAKAASRSCKIVHVPDAKMLKRLFGLSSPRFEVRSAAPGDAPECAIWIDGERGNLLPSLIAGVEFSSGDFRPFVAEGVPLLESPASLVREELLASKDSPPGRVLGQGGGESSAANSAIACLLLRKEFGAGLFGRSSRKDSPAVHAALGFRSEKDLHGTLSRYRANLIEDLKSGRTPDKYLRAGP